MRKLFLAATILLLSTMSSGVERKIPVAMRHRQTNYRLQAAGEGVKQLVKIPTFWSRTYYAGSVGHVSESTVKKYIENQNVADAKDVQISFVSQPSPARVAAGTAVRSLPSV